jgi:prolipoprotein diacylglyceryltransferase
MRIKNVVLGLGIFIVYLLALFQGVETFFPSPQYDDYCDVNSRPVFPGNDCQLSGTFINKERTCLSQKGDFVYEYDENGCPVDGYCDSCRIDYEKDLDKYANELFLISVILGVVVFFVGLFLLKKEPVGSALIGSAIFTVVYGTARNWRNFTESWRFLILFILLVLLIWLTLRLNSAGKKRGIKIKFWKKK